MADQHTKYPGRNEPCHCGSGKKYKHCCLDRDEEAERDARAQHAADHPAPPPEPERAPRPAPPRRPAEQPWRQKGQASRPFQKVSAPRKVGSS